MGGETSKPHVPVWRQLAKAIPPATQSFYGDEWTYSSREDRGVQAFANSGERERFIDALLVVLSNNNALNFTDHDFKLLYSRCPKRSPAPAHAAPPPPVVANPPWFSPGKKSVLDDGTRVVATLVALNPAGTMVAKIESESNGIDAGEAFRALKRDVEERLDEILKGVPSVLAKGEADWSAGGSERSKGEQTGRRSGDVPPPAYPGAVKR